MKIVIPDDYQDIVDRLDCFSLIRHHEVTRYREPAKSLDQLAERLRDAEIVVSIRERTEFRRSLIERLPKLSTLSHKFDDVFAHAALASICSCAWIFERSTWRS